jgi:hypothetical protein
MTQSLSLTIGRAGLALAALLATDLLLPAGTLLGPAPAHAIVGRPATPVSVAGVARRTTRRTVVATTAVVATTPPPGQVCETRYDADGQRYTVCK